MSGSIEPREPGNQPLEQMLDRVFLQAISGDPEQEGFDATTDLAVLWGIDGDMNVECVQILNWRTKDRVEVVRPTLDSEVAIGFLRDETTGAAPLFNVSVEDLFMRPYTIGNPTDPERISVPEINYSVFLGRICMWATSGEGEEQVVICSDGTTGTEEYETFRREIIDATGLERFLGTSELSPDDFLK